MTAPLKISIYIPTYNAALILPTVLKGLEALAYLPDEILVIDDGSTDGSAVVAQKFNVKIIRKEKNQGLAEARNMALREARNDLIACIDSDVLVEKEWLSELVGFMQNNPEYAAVGGRLDEKYHVSLADKWRKEHMPQHWGEEMRDDIPFLFGANGLYRKELLIDIGGCSPSKPIGPKYSIE